MKNKRLTSGILVLATAVMALQTTACKRPRDPATPAEMKEKLADKLDFVFWKIDATDEQEKRFDKLLDGLAPDLFAFQEESKVIKKNLIKLLMGEKVTLEGMMAQEKAGVDLFDRYMTRMSRAAVDASDILTLDQRRELVGMWKRYEFGDQD
ncbi:MAG: hypothetical protein GXP54_01510 [Deltaproteobacteria bacterium]|nr:hypothetical protein [Deltaproteobacteria bacterium]